MRKSVLNCFIYEDEINKKLLELCEQGTELFLVGGYIRDILLNRECLDKDYAVKDENAINFARKAAEAFDGHFVLLDEEHDIARVVMPDKKNTLDFAGCFGQDILTDLKNRDYTINAIACKIEKSFVSPPPCPPPQGGGRMVAEGAAPPPPAPNKVDFLPELKKLCAAVKNEFPAISGVLVNYNTKHSNVILGKETELIEGKDYIEEILEGRTFHISAESFFQVNPLTAQKMFLEVRGIVEDKVSGYFSDTVILSASEESVQHTKTAIIPNGTDPSALPQDDKKIQHDNFEKPSILDVYAGSGSFSMFLSDLASNITAVEESESSVNDGLENLRLNKIENITFIQGNADEVLKKMTGGEQKPENEDEEPIIIEPQAFDIVILDPPRRGCSESVIESIKKLAAKYIIYISCNPSTLARDVKLLSEDFIPEYIQPVDMFCHTYHVESILVLTKK